MENAKDFWRGISTKDYITENHPNYQAFRFDENPKRLDTYLEMSINWNDSPESLQILLNQRKDNGKIQFKAGVTRLELSELKQFLSPFLINESFTYERNPISNNQYHGNLLIKKDLEKTDKLMIQHSLAMLSVKSEVIPNPNS